MVSFRITVPHRAAGVVFMSGWLKRIGDEASVWAQRVCDSAIWKRETSSRGQPVCLSQHLDSPVGAVIPALWCTVYLSASLITRETMHLSCFRYVPSAQQGACNTEVLGTYLLNKCTNQGINDWMNGYLPGCCLSTRRSYPKYVPSPIRPPAACLLSIYPVQDTLSLTSL